MDYIKRLQYNNVPQHKTIESKEREPISLPPIRSGRVALVSATDGFGSLPGGSTVEIEMEQTKVGGLGIKDPVDAPLGSIEQAEHGKERSTGNMFGETSKLVDLVDKKDEIEKANGNQSSGEDDENEESEEINKEDDPSWFYFHEKWTQMSPNSLWIFGHENPLRRLIIWVILHKYFDAFIVLLIMTNSIMLGIMDYDD